MSLRIGRVVAVALSALTLLLVVAMFASFFLAIWSGDERWAFTGFVTLFAVFGLFAATAWAWVWIS